jgi:DNA-binding HxlR family transcriptional regulator
VSPHRIYPDQCGIALSLNVIGERWALLVVRELLFGPKRFNDLLAGLAGASPNVISQRVRELSAASVIQRRELGPPANVHVYELSEWGRELEPVLFHLGGWGSRIPAPPGAQISLDSLMLSVAAVARSAPTVTKNGTYQLSVGADRFIIETGPDGTGVRRGSIDQPDATMTTDLRTLVGICLEGRDLAQARRSRALTFVGHASAVRRLTKLMLAPFR